MLAEIFVFHGCKDGRCTAVSHIDNSFYVNYECHFKTRPRNADSLLSNVLAANNVLWQPCACAVGWARYAAFAVATGHNKDGATAATTAKFKFNTHFTASCTLYSYICARCMHMLCAMPIKSNTTCPSHTERISAKICSLRVCNAKISNNPFP